MTQDNIQQDTPQENVQTETAKDQYVSLEEAVFGAENNEGSSNISDIFTTGQESETNTAPTEGQPEVSKEGSTSIQPDSSDNDTKRYQYWQSQADRYKNELEQAKQQQQQVQSNTAQPVEAPVPERKIEEFPPPPERPQRPRTFSREEAYTDSSSESARYLDSQEDWDEQMVEYSALKGQYESALLQDKLDKMESARLEEGQKREAMIANQQRQSEVVSYVTGHHGLSEAEAADFIKKMSDPASINIDNLVQLYRLTNGMNSANISNNTPQPSPAFQQTQNAQQVPSSMGVMPAGQSNVDGRSVEDKMMDTMVGNFNEKNPWK